MGRSERLQNPLAEQVLNGKHGTKRETARHNWLRRMKGLLDGIRLPEWGKDHFPVPHSCSDGARLPTLQLAHVHSHPLRPFMGFKFRF